MIEPEALEALVDALRGRGYRVSGRRSATARSSTTSSTSAAELPVGWTDEQDGGTLPARAPRRRGALRLRRRPALVEAVPAPAARAALAGAARRDDGVRGRGGAARRRRRSRSSACAPASCTRSRSRTASSSAAATPTATTRPGARTRSSSPSTASSPAAPASASRWAPARRPSAGYDLALTEILDGEHRFLVEVGSERGAEVLAELPRRAADAPTTSRPPAPRSSGAAAQMGRAARHRPTSRTCSRATSSTRAGTRSPSAA